MNDEMKNGIQELSAEEMEALGGNLGQDVGAALHHGWNWVCATAQMLTDTYGPEIWNTCMYS